MAKKTMAKKPTAEKSLAQTAAALAARALKIKDPVVVDHLLADRDDARSRKSTQAKSRTRPLHCFRVVSQSHANGPVHMVFLDGNGEAVAASPATKALFLPEPTATPTLGGIAAGPPITINPNTNVLTLNPSDTLDETITVTIPKNAGPAKADVYFLADTTGSMGGILAAVQAGANNILTALNGLGVDIAFGAGNYKDFAQGDPYGFQHQLSPTNAVAAITGAIGAWSASGGGDFPEAGLFALDSLAVVPGGSIGWRPGSKRIIVWFGDAPSHDPICTAASGQPTVTEAGATAKLVAQSITVLPISTANPGLDDAPGAGYIACGPGGAAGQGTRIATQTGGVFTTGINPGTIANTIINLLTNAIGAIQNVKLVPSAAVAGFITSITPPGGFGPLSGDQDHTLIFDVKFHGIPCTATQQVISGTIDVVADGVIVASKKVQITVPPCAPKLFVYAVKFICGVQPECGCECTSVQPGKYATEINIHNYSAKEVRILKRFIPVVLAGAAAGREPGVAASRAQDTITLPAHTATMDDCCRISQLLFGAPPSGPLPLTIGFLEITAAAELAVTAVYTSSGLNSGGVAIAVEQITAQRA